MILCEPGIKGRGSCPSVSSHLSFTFSQVVMLAKIILSLFFFTQGGLCAPKLGCKTVGGRVTGKPCVFPFRYNGVLYNECTKVFDTKLWCSTSTNSSNDHQSGNWGYCPSDCQPMTPSTTSATTSTITTTSLTAAAESPIKEMYLPFFCLDALTL